MLPIYDNLQSTCLEQTYMSNSSAINPTFNIDLCGWSVVREILHLCILLLKGSHLVLNWSIATIG